MSKKETKAFLQEEILHLKRSLGFQEWKASLARTDVLGRLHQALDHRLDNIRRYADRPNPNGPQIVALVDEIIERLRRIDNNE